jgi:glycosyltransferase involved in cell wall biosynthesis
MKILVFTTQIYQLGGAEKLALELVHGLNSINIEAHLAVLYDSSVRENNLIIEELICNGFCLSKVFFLNMKPNPNIIDISKAVRKLKILTNAEKYDTIETSMMTTTIISIIALLFSRIQHVIGLHQSFQTSMYKDVRFILFGFLTWISTRKIYYGISEFVTASWRNSRYTKITHQNSLTLYNNISWLFNKFENLNIPIPKLMQVKGKKILFVGRLTRLKGYDILFHSVTK